MWLYSGASKRSANPKSSSSHHRAPSQHSSSSSSSTPTSRQTSPSSALTEVLRKNPFRTGSKESLPAGDPEDEDPSVPLNKDLLVLADFFPDVKVEVLRELLVRFDGDSRLPIATEQLHKYKAEWAKGRLNVPPRSVEEPIPADELFRTKEYKDAVRRTVGREFSALGKSAIDAVLAEVNFSYTNARPTLQELTSRSWKATFANLLKKKRSQAEPPSVLLDRTKADPGGPRLISTGSRDLDKELSNLFSVSAQSSRRPRDQQAIDLELAQALNLKEAEDAGALFECQVCYNDVTFEDASFCTHSNHTICLDCARHTLHEALFGQGWAKSVDVERGTLKCLAADDCDGHIHQDLLKRALDRFDNKSSAETWKKFQDRLAEHNLQHSALPLVRCPYCSYAEVEQIYDPDTVTSAITWRLRKPTTGIHTIICILLLELLPATILFLLPFFVLFPRYFITLFYTSLAHLAVKTCTTRFQCRNPSCMRKSCLKCQKAWHDPHVCHEPLILSLRTTVEAARTAAIKRTCPRCGTSFVKTSGCNKLTCVCGYSMCYLCRKNIGKAGSNIETGEGYRHFCEHFRPIPGQKCQECDRCDLYRAEDEDLMVRRAGEEAERVWREKEGMVGVKGLEDAVGNVAGEDTVWKRFKDGRWTVQGVLDWLVERAVIVEVE
ncbi:hypothetical protein AYO21_08802 [Fonsecaea monophora]|uniref:RING-type domain-containing protein n=1 Tax=Fonsecaea monophora TaxID=254056 RepID=A0A177F162_9EURO|nr:hypothetical protein AYO21_08802 [Fonsecaea monophora]KAH0836992.1 putative RING finger protein (Zin) [Fonsecaea pedrosoi]OAG36949.1 hypothetical protein AYO21_08802 [Fonsecaea monophora]